MFTQKPHVQLANNVTGSNHHLLRLARNFPTRLTPVLPRISVSAATDKLQKPPPLESSWRMEGVAFCLSLFNLRAARVLWKLLGTQVRHRVDETCRSEQRESSGVVLYYRFSSLPSSDFPFSPVQFASLVLCLCFCPICLKPVSSSKICEIWLTPRSCQLVRWKKVDCRRFSTSTVAVMEESTGLGHSFWMARRLERVVDGGMQVVGISWKVAHTVSQKRILELIVERDAKRRRQ